MKIIRAKDYKDMSRKAANIISAQVIMKPNCVLGLATGGTPVGAYAQLVDWYNKGDLDFSEVTTVNLDEYRGLPKEHPESYWSFMHKNLFDKVNIRPEAIHLPDGTNPDAADACKKYNEIIHSVGGIDLQLLGIGHDGHIGFNEPSSSLASRTRIKTLATQTRIDNARFFGGDVDQVPTHCITQGLGTIMDARHVVLVASGHGKAEAVHQLAEGPVSAMWPATILQHHPHVTVLLDEAAAGRVQLYSYYRETYAAKPQWQGL